jgi:hypothetical protein
MTKSGLIHYWSFNGNFKDHVGDSDLNEGKNYALTNDRFNNEKSALCLKNGFLKLPPNVYFADNNFSVLAWVNVKSLNEWSSLLEVGNERTEDNVSFLLSYKSSGKPMTRINFHNIKILEHKSNKRLEKDKWQHLAFVLKYPLSYIFIDGEITSIGSSTGLPRNVVRTCNYIGKSNSDDMNDLEKDTYLDIDDLKIFNTSLDQNEIIKEMKN